MRFASEPTSRCAKAPCGLRDDEIESQMARGTEVFRLPVLVMAVITVGFRAVMAVVVGIGRLQVCSRFRHRFCVVTLQTLDHGNRFPLVVITMTIGAGNALAGMELIQQYGARSNSTARKNAAQD